MDCTGDEENSQNEDIVTMVDVLKDQQDLEDDADAVLGASGDQECTYNKGYMKRQALYACLSCYQLTKSIAGICLACSLQCHEKCNLVELYTKRNFRCDCGNSKFFGRLCNLNSEKALVNELNKYNKNFEGLYCVCQKPYPDPEDASPDDMIQCIVCEDWYHCKHVGSRVPESIQYCEMICDICTLRLEFLSAYSQYTVTENDNKKTPSLAGGEEDNIEIPRVEIKSDHGNTVLLSTEDSSLNNSTVECEKNMDSITVIKDLEGNQDAVATASTSKEPDQPEMKSEVEAPCLLAGKVLKPLTVATFWIEGWRKQLCTCDSCKQLYSKEGVPFLVDEEDTVQFYEEQGSKARKTMVLDKEMKLISSLPRVQQIEVLSHYNDMKTRLNEYLDKFAKSNKVVSAENIREFFEKLEERKRRKISTLPPFNCR